MAPRVHDEMEDDSDAGRRSATEPIVLDSGERWFEERTRVAVGRNVTVSGKLIFQEPVRIEGRFRGEVSSTELVVVGEYGMLEGRVHAPRLLVEGELRGDVEGSKRVVLGARARVYGNIEADNLRVCEGAQIDGHLRVTGNSKATVTRLVPATTVRS
ncbi:MAG: bactofilin family protein [Candidatus Binataceae bacterium]